jgi:hypothetical protein
MHYYYGNGVCGDTKSAKSKTNSARSVTHLLDTCLPPLHAVVGLDVHNALVLLAQEQSKAVDQQFSMLPQLLHHIERSNAHHKGDCSLCRQRSNISQVKTTIKTRILNHLVLHISSTHCASAQHNSIHYSCYSKFTVLLTHTHAYR